VTAGDGKSLIKTEASVEDIYGRWINPTYDGSCTPNGKIIVNNEKIYEYTTLSSPEYSYMGRQGKYVVADSWVDLKGNSYYKIRLDWPMYGINYELWKISNSGQNLEISTRAFEYPTGIIQDSYRVAYHIYYRP
jgi:hypothetical protein